MKLLEGKTLYSMTSVLGVLFLDISSQIRETSKNEQMLLHKTKKLLHGKGNYQ